MLVALPNGQTAEFPDTMAPGDIEKVLQAQFGQGTGGGQGQTQAQPTVTAGNPTTAAAPADGPSWLPHWAQVGANALVGGLAQGLDYAAHPLMVGDLPIGSPRRSPVRVQDVLTLPFPGATPAGTGERYEAAGLSGLGAAAPTLLLGGNPIAMLGAGAAGGMASETLNQLYPGAPDWMHVASGVAPGLAMGGIGWAAARSELGQLAESMGVSKTLQEAGEHLQNQARNWLSGGLRQSEDQAWGPLDAAMHQGGDQPLVRLNNLESGLKAATAEGALDARQTAFANVTTPGLAKQMLSTLRGDPDPGEPTRNPILQDISDYRAKARKASGEPGVIAPVDWDFARHIRSTLGDAMADPQGYLFRSLGKQQLSSLYGDITADLGETAAENGAGELFDNANATSARLRGVAEQHLAPLVAEKATPGTAVKSAMQNAGTDGTRLTALRSVIPDAVDELAAAHLQINPKQWSRLSAEARNALVPDPQMQLRIGNAVQRVTGQPSELTQLGREMIGGSAGGAAGVIASDFLGTPELPTAGYGELAGLFARPLLRGIGAAVQQPNLLRLPLASGIGGMAGNALTGQGQ